MAALTDALACGRALPTTELARAGSTPLQIRSVPTASPRPAFTAHARLRRTSPIAHYAVAAALEALGPGAAKVADGSLRLGIVLCVMTGCVNYSRRFYDETLKDPATASPIIFPETVFNAPSSHLAALLGTTAINYTLVGDPGTFLQGLALAADWLLSEGAGALYLRRDCEQTRAIQLSEVTDSFLFSNGQPRSLAAVRARNAVRINGPRTLLCDGLQGVPRLDRDEQRAWNDWAVARLSVKRILGEGLMAAA